MIVYVCERVQVTHVLCQVIVECYSRFFLSIQHISDNTVHTNVLISLIAIATGMDQAFQRVVNSHILRFAIAMRVYVRIFGAVTVW